MMPEVWALHGRWRAAQRAVESWDGVLTWAELIERTNQVGNGLSAMGLRPGDRAAVLMANSLSTVEILVGLMRAGIVAVPLNPGVTDESLGAMMRDAGTKALFLSEEHVGRAWPDGLFGPGCVISRGGGAGLEYA